MTRRFTLLVYVIATIPACGSGGDDDVDRFPVRVVTFNTGTTEGLAHDTGPDDGYTSQHAAYSDQYYGDGLAWMPAMQATRAFFDEQQPDIVGFQEIFDTGGCDAIPVEARVDFICDTWVAGDPTVAVQVLGDDYQVMCHPGKPDKCAAVRTAFGSFRGCAESFCLEGLQGFTVDGCGRGARVGRAVIDLVAGGSLTLVNFHGSSGLTQDDQDCRVSQIDQVFVDLGDGEPGANGARNIVIGDFNTDPGRFAANDRSAARWNEFVGAGEPFVFISDVGEDAPPSYQGAVNIDHVISDAAAGGCWIAGVTESRPDVIDAIYFDHKPIVCDLGVEVLALAAR